jgi:acetylornithine aminotransferase/acetylornithine/N-succinyldiaminopimelate aminotransferase
MGLMIGMELNNADIAGKMVTAMLEHHVIINRTSETVLRFLPPYLITKADVDEGVAALDSALTEVLQAHTVLAGDHTHGE